jgi:pSer/pThr/pTyr-binding forkhead associated (FHA) protein
MDEFLRACGATGPLQLTVEDRGRPAVLWSRPQPFALIGSDPGADVSLDNPRVDRYHTYLQMIEGGVFWVDLESQSGTRSEDGAARSGWLDRARGIGVGPYLIGLAPEVNVAPGSIARRIVLPDPFSSRPPDSDDLPHAVLEFRRESAKPIRWRMRHILTLLGSSPHCKVRLAALGVSPFHCSLLRTPLGMWVVNLLGSGGLAVNGSDVRAARLEDGDELRLGELLIRVLFRAPNAAHGEIRALTGTETYRASLLPPSAVISRELATNQAKDPLLVVAGGEAARLLVERVSREGDLSSAMLATVLDEFGEMQQQFLSQFQQTTLMIFRALGTMHRDQMEELRGRFDSLQKITDNLQAFQAQMTTTAPPALGRTAHEGVPPTAPASEAKGTSDRVAGAVESDLSSVAAMLRETQAAAENATKEIRGKVRSVVDQPGSPNPNVHEWLIGRLAALEDEQRSRWQRILDLVRGR